MSKEKRTSIDWSKHELIIEEHETHTVHWLKQPDTICLNVKFTNIHGQLLVTGDFKSWVFCREFTPCATAEAGVSDGYWCEKLSIANHRIQYENFDPDYTRERILEEAPPMLIENYSLNPTLESKIKEYIETSDYLSDVEDMLEEINLDSDLKKEMEYWGKCYQSADDEYDYIEAMRDMPDGYDFESYIIGKKMDVSLDCVFDAFEEICRRLSDEKNK